MDELLTDPRFLLQADPATLGVQLHRAVGEQAKRTADVYRTSRYRYQHASLSERRDLLVLDAIRHGDGALAGRLADDGDPDAAMRWRPLWSTGSQATPMLTHVMHGHTGGVTHIASSETDGTPLIVTAGSPMKPTWPSPPAETARHASGISPTDGAGWC